MRSSSRLNKYISHTNHIRIFLTLALPNNIPHTTTSALSGRFLHALFHQAEKMLIHTSTTFSGLDFDWSRPIDSGEWLARGDECGLVIARDLDTATSRSDSIGLEETRGWWERWHEIAWLREVVCSVGNQRLILRVAEYGHRGDDNCWSRQKEIWCSCYEAYLVWIS